MLRMCLYCCCVFSVRCEPFTPAVFPSLSLVTLSLCHSVYCCMYSVYGASRSPRQCFRLCHSWHCHSVYRCMYSVYGESRSPRRCFRLCHSSNSRIHSAYSSCRSAAEESGEEIHPWKETEMQGSWLLSVETLIKISTAFDVFYMFWWVKSVYIYLLIHFTVRCVTFSFT